MDDTLRTVKACLWIAVFVLLIIGSPLSYAKEKTTLYFFWGNGCPHCDKEKLFLSRLERKYPELQIKSHEVWYDLENAGLFAEMARAYGKRVEGVPSVFIGDFEPVVGYLSDEVTGRLIEEKVSYCIENGCVNPLGRTRTTEQKIELDTAAEQVGPAKVLKQPSPEVSETGLHSRETPLSKKQPPLQEGVGQRVPGPNREESATGEPGLVRLPVLGEIDTAKTSLPLLTVVIAGLDGFNPCAFFVLFLLLSILIYAQSRKTMLLIGGTFVFFSGFVYFIFMAAWLNLFLLVGQLKMITLIAGAIAVLIALVNIKDFFFFKKGVSLSIPEAAKPKLFERTRGLLKKGSLPSMMFGTVVLAIAANTYELLCTAGFPMVYTRALTLNNLPTLTYYLYLLLYNVIYVIPLAAIVVTFTITLGARKLTEWQGQVLKLISGIMMLYLGIVLLARPMLLNNILISAGLLMTSFLTAGMVLVISRKVRGHN